MLGSLAGEAEAGNASRSRATPLLDHPAPDGSLRGRLLGFRLIEGRTISEMTDG